MKREFNYSELIDIATKVAADYLISTEQVIDLVCTTLSEVLTSTANYKIEVELTECGIRLIGRVQQHGIERDIVLSPSRIGKAQLRNALVLLKQRLAMKIARLQIIKYALRYERSLIYGRILSKAGEDYIVEIENIDGNVIGIAERRYLLLSDRNESSFGRRFLFYVCSILPREQGNNIQFVFHLSRVAKRIPELFLENSMMSDPKLILKCIYRKAGAIASIKSTRPIKKEFLKSYQEEFYGEIIKLTSKRVQNG